MREILIQSKPNQEFDFSMNNISYSVILQSRNGKTYLSYREDGEVKLLNRICLNKTPIDGLFMFEDTQGNEDPYYVGFETRFKLRLLI